MILQRAFSRFPAGVWVATALWLFAVTGFSIGIPFLALYLNQERGIPVGVVGAIILVAGLGAAIFQAVSGLFSDRFGRRALLLGSSVAAIFFYLGLAALIYYTAPVWSIALTYIVSRAMLISIWPSVSATVIDLVPKERLTEAYGIIRVGGNVGWAAGPALGGYLATSYSYAYLFALAAVSSVLSVVLVLLFLRESAPEAGNNTSLRSVFAVTADRQLLTFTVLSLLIFTVSGQMMSTLSIFTVGRLGFSTAQFGLLLTVNGLFVVIFQYPVARITENLGHTVSLVLGSVLYGIGYLMMGVVVSFPLAIGAMLIITAGEVVISPTTLAVVGKMSPEEWRGRYMGFYGLSQTVGTSVGPLVGGILLDVSPENSFLVWSPIAVLAFLSAGGFYWWMAKWRR